VITNAGLVAGVIVGLALLLAGILLMRRSPSRGGATVALGSLLFLGAEVYGLIVLKPFVGRPYDDKWHEQISSIEAAATLGLLICAAGLVAHALKLAKR
jgi:uncharacterized membrane protein HdeD (DUF308 family)